MAKVVAIIFGVYAAYSIWVALGLGSYIPMVGGSLSAIAAIGLWLHKRWSQYIVYVVSALVVAQWLLSVWAFAKEGWPYSSVVQSLIALFPGLCMVGLALGSSVFVFRSFRVRS